MKKVLIIAEAGVNHNGKIKTAKKLIDTAVNAGADIVKFQSFITEEVVIKKSIKAHYQKRLTNKNETQFEMIKKLELSKEGHLELFNYCKKKNIEFLSSPFDIPSAIFLNKLGVKRFKIPSGEITNLPYLRLVGSFGKPIILSTGMSLLTEVKQALSVLNKNGTPLNKITVLHSNTEYPTPFKDVNLQAMLTIRDILNVQVGYSDHTLGFAVPCAATALGAKIIEKHFTLNRFFKGPDHIASLEPNELKVMVRNIRNIEKCLGSAKKKPSVSETKNIKIVRKSIVASCPIKKGDTFSKNNLTTKRPGFGISPMLWDKVIGKKSKKNYKPEDLIKI